MRDVESVSNDKGKCLHNTDKGLAWKQVIHKSFLFGLITSTLIEKECQACGATFLTDTKGRRLLN